LVVKEQGSVVLQVEVTICNAVMMAKAIPIAAAALAPIHAAPAIVINVYIAPYTQPICVASEVSEELSAAKD
jgi:hypothetical protein